MSSCIALVLDLLVPDLCRKILPSQILMLLYVMKETGIEPDDSLVFVAIKTLKIDIPIFSFWKIEVSTLINQNLLQPSSLG